MQLLHSHYKWKDSLETRAVLFIFSLELEISDVAHRKYIKAAKKWLLPAVLAIFYCYALRQLRRSLRFKKIITNPPSISSIEKSWLLEHP